MKKILLLSLSFLTVQSGSFLQEVIKTTKFLDRNSPSPLTEFIKEQAIRNLASGVSAAVCSHGAAGIGISTQAQSIPEALPYIVLQASAYAGINAVIESVKKRSIQCKNFFANATKDVMARVLFLGINRIHGTVEPNANLIRFQQNHPDVKLAIDAVNSDLPSIIMSGISSRILPD